MTIRDTRENNNYISYIFITIIIVAIGWSFTYFESERKFDCFITTVATNETIKAKSMLKKDPMLINRKKKYAMRTPLFYAPSKDMAELLLASGAQVDIKDNHGSTPLYVMASLGKTDIMKSLIHRNANVNETNNIGMTPLHSTAKLGIIEATKLLISSGANLNAKNDEGNTPLSIAIAENHTAVADLLRKHGAKE